MNVRWKSQIFPNTNLDRFGITGHFLQLHRFRDHFFQVQNLDLGTFF